MSVCVKYTLFSSLKPHSLCCAQYIWNIDIMRARALRLERKMEDDNERRIWRYIAKVCEYGECVRPTSPLQGAW